MALARPVKITLLVVAWAIAGVVVAVLALLATLFLYYTSFPWAWARVATAAIFVIAVIALFIVLKPRWKALVGFAILYAVVHTWYTLIPARNDRDWMTDVAQVASVEFNGDQVTIHNVRDFRYRSETDYDVNWDVRSYDLSTLRSAEICFSYWGPTDIAHTMLSFGFEDGEQLVVSVETRKEVGEIYDPLRSFFKQVELIYLLGDERDLFALRTNTRLEDSYLFPLNVTPDERRALLVDILERADELGREPAYYATIDANCTTSLLGHLNRVRSFKVPFSFKLLLNGYIPELAYERGNLPNDAPFEEVMQRYAISAKGRAGDVDADYSARIRRGLP